MRALVMDQQGLRLSHVADPAPLPREALIKVRLAGICRTDLELSRGYMNFCGVPGHEFVGDVVQVNDAAGQAWVGKRVVGEINCGCGECDLCRAALERHCPQRTVLGILGRNGALAQYLTLPIGNLHEVPDGLPDQAAVFTEPLAAALEILEQMRIEPADRVLVIGDGKLGLLIARVLQIHGCDLLCLGSHDNKMDVLRGWGIRTIYHRDYQPDGRDVVIEASGSPQGFAAALKALRPRGTLVLKSTYQGALHLDAAPIVINEITVLGSRCGPFAPALRLLEMGVLPVEPLISAVYPAGDAETALERAAAPEALKVLVSFE